MAIVAEEACLFEFISHTFNEAVLKETTCNLLVICGKAASLKIYADKCASYLLILLINAMIAVAYHSLLTNGHPYDKSNPAAQRDMNHQPQHDNNTQAWKNWNKRDLKL